MKLEGLKGLCPAAQPLEQHFYLCQISLCLCTLHIVSILQMFTQCFKMFHYFSFHITPIFLVQLVAPPSSQWHRLEIGDFATSAAVSRLWETLCEDVIVIFELACFLPTNPRPTWPEHWVPMYPLYWLGCSKNEFAGLHQSSSLTNWAL